MNWLLDAAYSATLLPHYAYHRFATGRYGPAAPEKLGRYDAAPPQDAGPTLWVHAVSVGEALAARSLVRGFLDRHPGWRVVVSTTTPTGRKVAGDHFGPERVVYYPLDLSWTVRRAFDRIRPHLVVLMELEVWPHFLEEAERRGVPVAVSNVRITGRSVAGFRRLGGFGRRMLGRVALWLAQNTAYADALRALGVPADRVEVVGSLKYDGLDFSDDPARADRLRTELGGGRLLVAGSTHAGEDEIVYAAFLRLREAAGPDVRLVLVPRHPERCDAVERLAPPGLRTARRSAGAAAPEVDVVIGDTMGELADLYRAADLAFVGGTLLPEVGGHNMLEPAAFARPVVYGPDVHNFTEPAATLEAAGGAVRLPDRDAATLADACARLLADPAAAAALGARAREAAQAMQGATARSLDLLDARGLVRAPGPSAESG